MKRTAIFLFPLFGICASAQHVLPVFEIQGDPWPVDIGAPTSYPLSTFFKAEPIDNQVVRFVAQYSDANGVVTRNIDMALFSNRTPVTRANFLQYVNAGAYTDSFIHRSAPEFVIQGGGFAFDYAPGGGASIVNVPTLPPIINEPGISNTLGTISMAKTSLGPDTATSQWFISTAANSTILDDQNGGFTVFARITKGTLANALLFNNESEFPRYNLALADFNPALNETPLHNSFSGQQADLTTHKFISFPTVSLVSLPAGQAGTSTVFTHNVVTQPNSLFATASIHGGNVIFTPTGSTTGNASITLRATDSVGNEVIGTVPLFFGRSFQTWRNANFTGDDLTSDAVSGPNADPNGDGITNLQAFAQGLDPNETVRPTTVFLPTEVRLTYLEQTDTIHKRISFQKSTSLVEGTWQPVEGTTISSVNTAKPNQKSTTVAIPRSGERCFYRIVFELVNPAP